MSKELGSSRSKKPVKNGSVASKKSVARRAVKDPNSNCSNVLKKPFSSAPPVGRPAVDSERSIKRKKPSYQSPKRDSAKDKEGFASEKECRPSHRSVKQVRPDKKDVKKPKTLSPKYEFEPKLIETPNVKKEMPDVSKTEEEAKNPSLLANVESIRLSRKKCVHMWPTPADIAKLSDQPKPWSIPKIRQTQNLEYFVGRLPQWYIEEKFLKNPGDFCICRDASFKYILSVRTKEPGNPCAHFVIEFAETQLVRNDRNYYHRIVGTILQSNTVQGLIQKYRDSSFNLFKENLKRDCELLNPIPPCQGCIYSKQEYNYHYLFIRKAEDVKTGDLLSKGEGYRLFKGTRIIRVPTQADQVIIRNVVIREYDSQTNETLDFIVREMHIVQTIRFKVGWNTVVNVEGICTVQKPFHILYRICSEGCLSQYLTSNKNILPKHVVGLLRQIALTLSRVYKLGFLHCDICIKNMYAHIDGDLPKDAKDVNEPKKVIALIGCWKTAEIGKTKKFDVNKFPLISFRYLAPEVFKTEEHNEATEVYAFGLLVHEAMTNERVWKGLPDSEVKELLRDGKMLKLDICDYLPKQIEELVKKCTDTDPTARPTMKEVAKKLKEMADALPQVPIVSKSTDKSKDKSFKTC